jgi:hypothetical protein
MFVSFANSTPDFFISQSRPRPAAINLPLRCKGADVGELACMKAQIDGEVAGPG